MNQHQSLWQQLRGLFGGRVPSPRKAKRNYKAARVDRLNSGWTTQSPGANWILRTDLRTLRARAREMSRNNSHFRKFLGMARTNIVGPKGIQVQVRARLSDGSLDGDLNKRIEEAFWAWTHRETCSASQRLDWTAVQRLFVTHLVRDGEALVRHVRDRRNPFGYSVRLIDPSYLDEHYNDTLPNGNRVIMSVELDDADRRVAYHLTTPASEILFTRRRERIRTRVPASEIEHAFLVFDDEAQVRGVTWFHAAMLDAKNLAGYNDGVITSARTAAMSMGFLERESDETEFEGYEDEEGNELPVEIDISPVTFNELPAGYKLAQFDPKQPTQNHAAFVDTILRDVATGLGVNFFSLTGDLSSVNYSSARVGLGEERDVWRELQDFVGTHLCRPVYHQWLNSALLAGALDLTPAQFKEAKNPMWRGRGWRYLDPQKEVNANVTALQNNLVSLTDVLAEQGGDLTEHFETIRRERELAQEYGIELRYGSAPKTAPPDQEDAGDGQDAKRSYVNGKLHEEDLVQ